ncbi:hypothetical protein SAMN06272721_1175 [Arthrobacter sp. P2b]|nr:hypothetical protein SAMN06272721_1175 [Arthrobacter sp. P2b]
MAPKIQPWITRIAPSLDRTSSAAVSVDSELPIAFHHQRPATWRVRESGPDWGEKCSPKGMTVNARGRLTPASWTPAKKHTPTRPALGGWYFDPQGSRRGG